MIFPPLALKCRVTGHHLGLTLYKLKEFWFIKQIKHLSIILWLEILVEEY